ncbi:MAG TPA: S8 family serine peptidase, partial [Candidatus Norongarragalinales archaeon]|nr:S8 family serine peptidase [Candidatus Norongarragalinales archaeon]
IPGVAAELTPQEIEKLKTNNKVQAIFEDERVYATLSQSVPKIRADQVHASGGTGAGVKVCIVDTGVDDSHPAISALVAEYDFVNGDADAMDDNGHGTHVSGIVASTDSAYKGVAPGASLMAAKVLDSAGSGWTSDVISGIEWCVSNGADIISMSLGAGAYTGTCDSLAISQASNNAADQGVVVLAATGNNGYINAVSAPSCASKVIAVGAVDKNDGRTPYSNEGPQLDLVAPGSNIVSTYLGGGFVSLTGTSMATPHASGAAALLLGRNPALTPAEVKNTLQSTAVDLGAAGFDTIYGYGRVDAYAAYQSIAGEPPANQPPVANAGPDQAVMDSDNNGFETALLNGSASYDPDGTIVNYEWLEGLTVLGNGVLLAYNFSIGAHNVTLVVTDDSNATSSDGVIIAINPFSNQPPVANAGSDKVVTDSDGTSAESVTLDGSASYDPDGAIVNYEWKDGSTVLGTSAILISSFTIGMHNVILSVTDNEGATASDEVLVTVNANSPPVANAGPDKNAYVGDAIGFDGSTSTDSDGSLVSYGWDFGDGFTASGASVVHAYSAIGTYIVTLTVTDNGGATAQDTAIVTISNRPPATIFQDDFQSGNLNKWIETNEFDWRVKKFTEKNVPGHLSTNKVAHADRCTSSLGCIMHLKTPLSLSNYSSVTLKFWRYVDNNLDAGEFLRVEAYDGANWNTLYYWTDGAGDDDSWHLETLTFPPAYLVGNFNLRFVTRENLGSEEVELDDVAIEGIP